MKAKPEIHKRLTCSLCGQNHQKLSGCDGGYVCEPCAEKSRLGRDTTTRAVKTQQRSTRGQAQKLRTEFKGGVIDEHLEFDIESSGMLAVDALQKSSAVTLVTGREVLPAHDSELLDTLAAPGAAALDASANRLDLAKLMGTDVVAMAVDAADTIQASNSMEKMFAHQMAVLHDTAMRYVSKANLEQDQAHSVKMMNLGIRAIETFQKGLLTLNRLRGNGEQRITVQHVNIGSGGQAIVGQVQTTGSKIN